MLHPAWRTSHISCFFTHNGGASAAQSAARAGWTARAQTTQKESTKNGGGELHKVEIALTRSVSRCPHQLRYAAANAASLIAIFSAFVNPSSSLVLIFPLFMATRVRPTGAYVVSTYEPNMPGERHMLPTHVRHKSLLNNMLSLLQLIFGSLCSFYICSRRSARHKLSNGLLTPCCHHLGRCRRVPLLY